MHTVEELDLIVEIITLIYQRKFEFIVLPIFSSIYNAIFPPIQRTLDEIEQYGKEWLEEACVSLARTRWPGFTAGTSFEVVDGHTLFVHIQVEKRPEGAVQKGQKQAKFDRKKPALLVFVHDNVSISMTEMTKRK
jgi:hypothetical protein